MEPNPNSPDTRTCCNDAAAWKLPLLLAVVLLGIFLWKQNQSVPPSPAPSQVSSEWTPSVRPTGDTVGLEIDFGNGARRIFEALPYRAEMTVADVMGEARKFQPALRYAQVGEGAGGFLTELEGLKNEGASGRNWQYDVGGTPGNKSFCLQTVAPGELVRWTFAGQDENR
jgi:hypothetical protein